MDSQSANIDAVNTSINTNTDDSGSNDIANNRINTSSDYSNTDYNNGSNVNSNKTDTFNHERDNKRDNLRSGTGHSTETPTTDNDFVERDSAPRESLNRDVENRDVDRNAVNRDSNIADRKESMPKTGVAGVIASNFGADKTTTSTFEKSQGEKFGANFDETGEKLREKLGNLDSQASGSATGGGEYTMGGQQGNKAGIDTNVPHGSHNGTHKEGFGHKMMGKAEGMMHLHHHDKTESRTEA
ncbi:hypothetical protein TSTA_028880 [Talaromyces stipitatus ATCC 10500]|uniref:Uncharacterized protein n=1 Tax=Talaromyces stipitatus (strain ATCC 10500 / CBS 375.48 / QM 6759 / NRRL 1006) TaxID=441959 RepID=B8M7Q3_TALSN|nr:uncharacterized protein TSTA_028880 [Talaromyces stipitatus ATCC 10500]EED19606.1 hypothetical protein TSTA_028880 [Talaromyces stipitatus ATCC 10500]